MRLLPLTIMACCILRADVPIGKTLTQGNVTILLVPWTNRPIPGPAGFGIQVPVAFEQNGVMLFVMSANPLTTTFQVTVTYRVGTAMQKSSTFMLPNLPNIFITGKSPILSVDVIELAPVGAVNFVDDSTAAP